MLFTLSQVLVLFCALMAGSLGIVAILLLKWNRGRRELALYAALALAVAFWLATPLLTPVPIPLSKEILGRLVRALAFLLPAIGFLFLVRILGISARGPRMLLLVPPAAGLAAALLLPAETAWVDTFAVLSLVVVSLGAIGVLARKENRRRDTVLAFAATGILLAGAVAEIASRKLPGASSAAGVLLGTSFLAFTVFVLPTAADEDRRLFTRATTDAVTNLPNRGTFLARAREEIFRAERTRRTLAFVLLEMDGFEARRRSEDPAVLDEVLASYGQAVARSIRGIDVAGRWDKNMLSVLLLEADETNARMAIDRIRTAASQASGATASAGVSVQRRLEKPTVEDLATRAEAALDEATRDGGRDRSAIETREAVAAPVA